MVELKGGALRGALAKARREARARGEEVDVYGPIEEGRGYPKVVHQYPIPRTMLGPRLERAPEPVKEAVAEAYKEPVTFVAEPTPEPTPTPERVSMMGDIMGKMRPETRMREMLIPEEVRASVEERGVALTLVRGVETVVERPEVVVADIVGLKGEKREKYMEFAKPFYEAVKGPKIKTIRGEEYYAGGLTTLKEFAYVPAGFVGTFERYVRGDVPTPITAITQPIFEGGKVSEAQFLAEHPGYALGGLLGEWAQAKAISKLLEPVTTRVAKKLPKSLQRFFYKEELLSRKRIHLFEPKRARLRYSFDITGRAKSFAESTRVVGGGAYTPFETTLGKVIEVPTGSGQVLLQKVAPQTTMKQLPIVTLTKTVAPKVVQVAPKVVAKAVPYVTPKAIGLVAWLGLKYPFVKSAIWAKTVPKVKPYPIQKAWKLPKVTPKPSVTPKPVEVVKPKVTPSISTKQISSATQVVGPISAQTVKQIQQTTQIQRTKQIQGQKIIYQTKQITKLKAPKPFKFRWPEMKPTRRRKGLFGAWFYREHPIPTAKQMLSRMSRVTGRKRERSRLSPKNLNTRITRLLR